MVALLVPALASLSACQGDPAPDAAPAALVEPTSSAPVIEWLDDEAMASGVTHYRIAGQVHAPRDQEATLRKLLRDGLVSRAKALGFTRLDNLQIETECADAGPEGTACTARVVAIASR
ncbi:hypothetical protein L6R53_22100 [Myxococcota bacterium]|nr:hypothetical protein [Myxococcota bacterium]